MSDQTPFPEKPRASVTKDEVVNYLLQHQARGYQVFQIQNGGIELMLDEYRCIRFVGIKNGEAQVQGYAMSNTHQCFDCTSLADVTRAVDTIAHNFISSAWLQQLGVTGELRIMKQSEHRRFLLLSSG